MTEPLTLAQRPEWLIKKDGYFYRPGKSGYTTSKFEAGRYTEADARKEAEIEPWHMKAIHQDEVPDDLPSRTVTELEATIASLRDANKALTDRAIEAENDRDRFIEGKVLAECQRDAAEAKLAKAEADLRLAVMSDTEYCKVIEANRDRLSAELAEARQREERLQSLLVGRDVFIVGHDLWAEFVATLPLSPPPQPEAKEARDGTR